MSCVISHAGQNRTMVRAISSFVSGGCAGIGGHSDACACDKRATRRAVLAPLEKYTHGRSAPSSVIMHEIEILRGSQLAAANRAPQNARRQSSCVILAQFRTTIACLCTWPHWPSNVFCARRLFMNDSRKKERVREGRKRKPRTESARYRYLILLRAAAADASFCSSTFAAATGAVSEVPTLLFAASIDALTAAELCLMECSSRELQASKLGSDENEQNQFSNC